MKTFWIFRHGQTDRNLEHRAGGGRPETPLNETGRIQARELTAYFSDKNLEVIYSSPLARCTETARIIAGHFDLEVRTHKGLTERDSGSLAGRVIKTDKNYTPPDGEGLDSVAQRTMAAILEIAGTTEFSTIGVCTHSAPMVMLLERLTGQMPNFQNISNGYIFKVICTDGKLMLVTSD
jgi:probable phosphoglycerate mutase